MIQTAYIEKLSLDWDLRLGPFRGYFPKSEEEIAECLRMTGPGKNGTALFSASSRPKLFAACEDTRTNEIVACLLLGEAGELDQNPVAREFYNLSLIGEAWEPDIALLSPVFFRTKEQQTLITQVLISHCFIETLKAGGQALIIPCDIGFFSVYKRFGLRPIGSLRNDLDSGHSIPMIFLPDWEYLALIHSPVLDLVQGNNSTDYQPVCDWYYRLVRENSELQIGSAFHPEHEEDFEKHYALTADLSQQGLEQLLASAMVVKCREGEILISEDDTGKALGYVQKGIVQVVIGGKTVVLLSEGDIFGEIAFILSTKRSARVVAAGPDTEIVLFSEMAFHSLQEADRMIIWRNLARVVAKRLLLTNRLLS